MEKSKKITFRIFFRKKEITQIGNNRGIAKTMPKQALRRTNSESTE